MSYSSEDYEYVEKPLTLISFDNKEQKFVVNFETLEFIKTLQEPIAVISVAGLYRTGKSYLLNKMLLNTENGFGVGPTVNPCTKGLWLWGKPLRGKTVDGEDVNVLVIDSEGIGALDQDNNHDTRVFSLAILLASYFIYNSMGSIDEQAIDNLSLVVNLTKNIHIKANNGEEVDIEDYSKFFPSFCWIVRDFTLQLVDSHGENITSKEYLEKALQPQKGFSDSIEQKNRIRRHITGLFKDRDCFTFVRPVTKEEDLQNLNQMDLTDLRPEFVEEVIDLRKKVLGRIQPKTLNGKRITGEIFAELIKSYIEAMNEGAVPNIENAWTQICRNECFKWANEGLKVYDNLVLEEVCPRIPMSEEQMKLFHRRFKEKAMAFYKEKAMGEVSDVYERELSRQIKAKYAQLKFKNIEEGEKVCEQFLNKEYSSIDRKVRNHEYTNFQEYEGDIGLFYTYFMDKGPEVPRKENILLEFLHNCMKVAGTYFIKNIQKEMETQKHLAQDVKSKLEGYVNELKSEGTRERNALMSQVSTLQTEKTELELKETTLKEHLAELKAELGNMEQNLRSELDSEKNQNKSLIDELREKLSQKEEFSKELENKLFLTKSEFEKEKALLIQKAEFLEKTVDDLTKKEQEGQKMMNMSKNELASQIKESSSRYEETIKSLNERIEGLVERVNEQEDLIREKDENIENLMNQTFEHTTNRDHLVSEYKDKIKSMESDLESYRMKQSEEFDGVKGNYEDKIQKLSEQADSLQNSLKQKEEQFKNAKTTLEKENAVLKQKLEFVNLQVSEYKSQLDEAKKSNDQILTAFERSGNEGNKVDGKQLAEIKEIHEQQLKQLNEDYEMSRKKWNQEFEQLSSKNNELELKAQLLESDHATQIAKLREEIEQLDTTRKTLTEQNKNLETQKKKMYEEIEASYLEKIRYLEGQVEEKDQTHDQEMQELQSKNEENINQLKIIFEQEKLRFEKRIQDEKERANKMVNQQIEELEDKLHEQEMAHEEEIENLNDELREKENQYSVDVGQLEHELSLNRQTIESLEKYLKETKENMSALQATNSQSMEQHLENFNKERKQFLNKIEQMSLESSKYEKELFSVKQRNEQLEANLKKKEETVDSMRKEYSDERQEFTTKLEESRQKIQKLSDEYMEKKVEFGKEIALKDQQNEFLKKRIEELQKQVDESHLKGDDRLKVQKAEFAQQIDELTRRFNNERATLEEKYEAKRKASKESEVQYQKQAATLEKEKAVLSEKLVSLENKIQELEKKLSTDAENYTEQIASLKDSLNNEKKSGQADSEKIKNKIQDLEHENAELLSNYERDKALWEGKFNFLEQQRDQAKSDLSDTQKKFEITLQQLQKLRAADKEESESSQNALITSIEKRYQSKIQELQESYQHQIDDLTEKKLKLEKELKSMNDKALLDNYGKIGNQNLLEKKVADLMENEKKLQSEIEELKSERDSKVIEFQKRLDKELESMRNKVKDFETKYKESENKRNTLTFEHEKERAKWNLEKDYLSNQRTELQDQISKLERKKEQLLRENEKMKNDYKSKGKLNVNTSFNATAYKPNNGVMSRRDISPSPANKVGSILDKENIYSAAKHNYGIKPFEQYKMANLRQDNGDMRSASTRSNLSSNTSEHNEVSEPDQDTISTGAK